jgi:hypothetical protein
MFDQARNRAAPVAPDEQIVGAIAIYGSPDDLAEAVLQARRKGFTRLDTVSPYPLHGMDELLGRGPSRLGYVAAAAGLGATAHGQGSPVVDQRR